MKPFPFNNIFLYGLIQVNILGPLYKGIELFSNEKIVAKSYYFRVFSEKDYYQDIFREIESTPFIIASKGSFYKHLLLFLSHSSIWYIYLKLRKTKDKKRLIPYLKEMFEIYKKAQSLKGIEHIDFYHLHFLRYTTVLPFLFIKDKPVLMSFWGSDLLRNTDPIEDIYRGYAFKNATTITIQNKQLATMVSERFKVVSPKKIKVVKFLPDETFIEIIKRHALEKPRVHTDEYHVMVGHNGSVENQHIEILKAIATVQTEKKIIIHLLLSYALLDDYHQVLLEAIKDYRFPVEIQYEYLSQEALMEYRSQMDLLIFAPISDAMSGTVTEALYLGSKVIAGSWLPYNDYNHINCNLYFFDTFKQLTQCIETAIEVDKITDLKETHTQLDAVFGVESNIEKWIDIIQNL